MSCMTPRFFGPDYPEPDTRKESDAIVVKYYEIAGRMVADAQDATEFSLVYGRWPEPGEIAALRLEFAAQGAEHKALKSIRPGLLKMLRYWL